MLGEILALPCDKVLKYRVIQTKGGLFQKQIRIVKELTEEEVKELGFWSKRLEKGYADYFSGDNKFTTVIPLLFEWRGIQF